MSTSSALFFSCGSTTSMFWSYFFNKDLKSRNTFLIRCAKFLTALDYVGLIRLYIPSAAKRISFVRSSRPIPSGLATELILPKVCTNLALRVVYSRVSTTILPRPFSLCSIAVNSFSVSMASVIYNLASASINISSSTYICS